MSYRSPRAAQQRPFFRAKASPQARRPLLASHTGLPECDNDDGDGDVDDAGVFASQPGSRTRTLLDCTKHEILAGKHSVRWCKPHSRTVFDNSGEESEYERSLQVALEWNRALEKHC